VLYVQTREPRKYEVEEVHALAAIASQIAPVVDNARLLALIAEDGGQTEQLPPATGSRRATGVPCSSGVITGPVLVLGKRSEAPAPPASSGGLEEERERLRQACRKAREELLAMQDWLRSRNAEEAALVFSVQLMLLEDPAFEGRMHAAINDHTGAYDAVRAVTRDVVARFGSLGDSFFRERSEDVVDLAERLARHLRSPEPGNGAELRGKIVVLPDLAPSRLVSLCAEGVAGILTGGGGATGHAALLARSLDLPLVVGLGDFVHQVHNGQRVLVDAAAGEVVVEPHERLVAEATRAEAAGIEALRKIADLDAPGSGRLKIDANVSLWGDAVRARENRADGIGLYRTEFAFLMRPDLPGEDEQFELYARVVREIAPQPVTFRLLDAGGDKLVPALGQTREPNPFLGYRSLRLLLDHPDILAAQARAVLYALDGTPGRLIIPMVSSLGEFRAVRAELAKQMDELPPVGAMIEVPSALMQLEALAAEADFFSIGTNDLTQHLLAVDRTNARMTRFYDPYHPAILRAMHLITEAAQAAGKPVSVCGEMAGNPLLLPVWLGLGIERITVDAKKVPVLRALEAEIDLDRARAATRDILLMESGPEILERLEGMARREVLEYLAKRRLS